MKKCKWCAEDLEDEATSCPSCQKEQEPAVPAPSESLARWITVSQIVGILVVITGIAVGVYFGAMVDSTVITPLGRMNTPALVQDRENGLIAGVGITIIGLVMALKKV